MYDDAYRNARGGSVLRTDVGLFRYQCVANHVGFLGGMMLFRSAYLVWVLPMKQCGFTPRYKVSDFFIVKLFFSGQFFTLFFVSPFFTIESIICYPA